LAQTPGDSGFPTSIDTNVKLFETKNNSATTLSVALNNSATTATVVSTTSFPSTGAFVIDSEIIYYTGKTATTFTGMVRARNSTAAASHSLGASVRGVILSEYHERQNTAIIAIETKIGAGSSTPTAEMFFKGTGAGTSAWGALSSDNVTDALGYTPQATDTDLTAVAGLSTTGLAKRTGAGTWTTVTAPSGDVVGTTDTQTLTNKTVISPILQSPVFSTAPSFSAGTITGGTFNNPTISNPTFSAPLTLSSPALTSPTITSPTFSGPINFASGNVTTTGTITANAFVGDCSACTGITGATGGVSNTGSTTIEGDSDANGSGIVDVQIGGSTKWRINNDGSLSLYGRGGLLYSPFAQEINAAEFASLDALVTFASTTPYTVNVATSLPVINNVTTPSTLSFRFSNGGDFDIPATKAVTILSYIDAPYNQRIFKGAGTVNISISSPSVPWAGWWGVKADGVTDDTLPLQAAITATPASHGTLALPAGNIRITNTLVADAKLGFKLISGFGVRKDAYGGAQTNIYWDGAAGKIMLRGINMHSSTIQGIGFYYSLNTAANGAGYGLFLSSDLNMSLTGVSVTSGSTNVTITNSGLTSLQDSLPNGDALHRGRTVTINGAGAGGTNLVTTIASVTDPTHFVLSVAASTTVAGGTGTITTPYATSPGNNTTSHRLEDLHFNWSGATNNLAYRTGISIDLYAGTNAERIQVRNVTIYGNGGTGAATTMNSGIGISAGGGYDSGDALAVSPLTCGGSNLCRGGANILQLHGSDIFLYGLSYGFHGWSGTLDRIQGSYINVPFFGGFNGLINDARFETTRQFFHGYGSIIFKYAKITNNSIAGASVFQFHGGATTVNIEMSGSDLGSFYTGTSTKMVECDAGTNCIGDFNNVSPLDSTLSAQAGTDFTGFGSYRYYYLGRTIYKNGESIYLGQYSGSLPGTAIEGTLAYCSDCKAGTNPAVAGVGTGAFVVRQGGVWVALGSNKATATYDPPSVADGASFSTTISVPWMSVGQPVVAGHSSITTGGWQISGYITGLNTATITFTNHTGGTVDLASGTLTAQGLQ
jgi:hypothetical protein